MARAGCAWVFIVVRGRAWRRRRAGWAGWGRWCRAVGDGKGGVLGVVKLGVLVLGVTALAGADLDRGRVHTRKPHLARRLRRIAPWRGRGGGLDLTGALERASGGGVGNVDRVEGQRLVVDSLDADPNLLERATHTHTHTHTHAHRSSFIHR